MSDLERRVLEFLNQPGESRPKIDQLAKKMRLDKHERHQLEDVVAKLVSTAKLHQGRKGRLRLKVGSGLIEGVFRRSARGGGYVIPHVPAGEDRARDILIGPNDARDAQTGDEVSVQLLKKRGREGKRYGRIEQVLTRARNSFVGTYFVDNAQGFVRVDGRAFNEPVPVGDPGAKGAQPNEKVAIEMLRFPTHYDPGEGVLTKVLGPRGAPDVDTETVIHEMGLPDEFPSDVLDEAAAAAREFDEADLQGRVDLTNELIVTIDPVDARDFDDAISLNRSADGHWHLGVHIADVAEFVAPGSALDLEAERRGNSVYLPGRVLPMIPELISNGLASLQADRVRFTKSVLIEYSPEGIPLHTQFINSAIKVSKRFAYEEVLPIIQHPEKNHGKVGAKIRALLAHMHELAMMLRARRFAAGALELNIAEVKIDLDAKGRVIGAHETVHDESHQIIEEFMLAANFAVARELNDRGITFVRRIHPGPSELKMRQFAQFVKALDLKLSRPQSREELQRLLGEVAGKPTEHAVNYALLRSMKPAEYSVEDIGHYALSVDDYCHFTSPIRRYPDLVVHRMIDGIIQGAKRPSGPNEMELARTGKQCSLTERRAAAAERELVKIKLLEFMEDRVGTDLDAIITGVEQFGIFCRGVEIPAEGMIHVSSLAQDDYFDFDASAMALVGRRRGTRYRLGDRIRVTVAHVDVDRRELDFRPATTDGAKSGKSDKRKQERLPDVRRRPSGKLQAARRTAKKNRRRR